MRMLLQENLEVQTEIGAGQPQNSRTDRAEDGVRA